MKRVLILAVLLAACLGCSATLFAQQIGSYPYATTPLLGTEQMVGNQAATYPCVGCTVTITPAMIADYTFGLAPAFSILYNNNGAPGGLIPSATGQFCLNWSSLTAAPTLVTCSSGGGMVYPGAGIPDSTGTAWGTSYATTGSGDVVLSTSPTLVTPALGTPSAIVLTNGTGLPIAGLTGLGTGVGTALGVNTGSAGSFVVNGGALGTPSSGVGTNITGVDAASVGGFTLPCTVPTLVSGDYLTNNGTACSWSAVSASGITLQTNGTNNASQTALNLVGTGNVAVTNTTGGTVDIGPISEPVNAQTGTSYTITTSDCGEQDTFDNASAIAVGLPPASGTFASCQFDATDIGAGTATITPLQIGAPTGVASTATGSGGTLPAGSYYVGIVEEDAAGFTTVDATSTATAITLGQDLQVSWTNGTNSTYGNQFYIYYSTAAAIAGGQTSITYCAISASTSSPYNIAAACSNSGTVPSSNTTASTINGATSLAVAQNRQCTLNSDGTNWQVIGCTALVTGSSGTSENVQVFSTSGTWTKPSGSPQSTKVICTGGGGGGGGGAVEPSGTAAGGGGGGGGGSTLSILIATSSLPSTVSVTVGAGGAGGLARTSTNTGGYGTNGGNSSFGTYLTAFGGGGAAGGQSGSNTIGGGGGGILGAANGTAAGAGCGGSGNYGTPNLISCQGAGAGGSGDGSSAGAGGNGGSSALGGAGGGGGGGLATTPAAVAGGNGGGSASAAGTSGSTGNGAAGTSTSGVYAGGSAGSGGGSSTTGNGGTGGAGGLGAGGGGGGAAENGVGSSGAGGNGGNGECVVITSF